MLVLISRRRRTRTCMIHAFADDIVTFSTSNSYTLLCHLYFFTRYTSFSPIPQDCARARERAHRRSSGELAFTFDSCLFQPVSEVALLESWSRHRAARDILDGNVARRPEARCRERFARESYDIPPVGGLLRRGTEPIKCRRRTTVLSAIFLTPSRPRLHPLTFHFPHSSRPRLSYSLVAPVVRSPLHALPFSSNPLRTRVPDGESRVGASRPIGASVRERGNWDRVIS